MRTVSALAGALTVVPLYFVLRKLTARSDVALLACALLAVSSWHVTVSRITSPAAMHPFFELVGLVFLMCALDPDAGWVHGRPWVRALFAAAGGAAFGAAAQTYHTGRLAPLTAIALFLLSVRDAATSARHRAMAFMAFLLGLLAMAAPFLLYAWRQPHDFEARVTRVSLLGAAAANAVAPLTALDQSVGRHALMFNVRGDTNGRRNVPRRPMLDAVTGVGLIAGLLFIVQTRRWQYWFLGAGLLLGVLPSALAVEGPHALRAIGAVPYACAVAAIGWTWLIGPQGRPWRGAAGVGIVLVALTLNAWTYFRVAPCDDRVWKSFYPVETQIGSFIRDLCKREGAAAAERIYVDQDMATNSVVQYLAHGIRVNTFRAKGLSAPIRGEALFLVTDPAQLDQLATLLERAEASAPRLAGSGPMLPDGSRPAFTIWSALDRRARSGPRVRELTPAHANGHGAIS